MTLSNVVLILLLVINAITLFFFMFDKIFAMKDKWRVKEKTLILLGLFGGSLGALLAMILFRHKIRKPKFYILIPLFLAIHITLFVFCLIKGYIVLF